MSIFCQNPGFASLQQKKKAPIEAKNGSPKIKNRKGQSDANFLEIS
jgi:hypothetical protein